MISTQHIKSTTTKPIPLDNYETIKWNNSKWKNLCPYLLKTDGEEKCANPGGILFENFYQGCKVYTTVYENKVYPSRYQTTPWWTYEPVSPRGDVLLRAKGDADGMNYQLNDYLNDELNYDLYYRWRNSIWECPNPIRYPNKFHRKKYVQFALVVDKEGQESRYGVSKTDLRSRVYSIDS